MLKSEEGEYVLKDPSQMVFDLKTISEAEAEWMNEMLLHGGSKQKWIKRLCWNWIGLKADTCFPEQGKDHQSIYMNLTIFSEN